MRTLKIKDQPVDLIQVQHKLLGDYSNLQIDMCTIIDRWDKIIKYIFVSNSNFFDRFSNTNFFKCFPDKKGGFWLF